MTLRTLPLWAEVEPGRKYPRLDGDRRYDVVVIGAGVTGITAALMLKRAGKKVALVEMQRALEGETGHTTSHLTELIDRRYYVLEHTFGRYAAELVAESSRRAIDRIEAWCEELPDRAHFRRVPLYLYTDRHGELRDIEREVEAAARAGVKATFTTDVPLPYPTLGAMRAENQGQVHPREYLRPLLDSIPGDGCDVFEQTRVTEVHDGEPCEVETEHGRLTADRVIVAAYSPFMNRFFLQTKVAPYRTYALAAKLRFSQAPGLFYDNEDPYHYVRTQQTRHGEYLIVGGEDHKVGPEHDANEAFARLEAWTLKHFEVVEIPYRWSGQILEPVDGLPFIGRNSISRHVFVATGFSGTGMTWGTLAAEILVDEVLDRENPYAELYQATRVKPLAQARDFVTYNAGYPYHLVTDRLKPAQVKSVDEVPPGEGRIVRVEGKKVAVYRDEEGEVTALSPICTHMYCLVGWNDAEKSWDCHCHGGRFSATGKVLNGPAAADLERLELEAPSDEEETRLGSSEEGEHPSP